MTVVLVVTWALGAQTSGTCMDPAPVARCDAAAALTASAGTRTDLQPEVASTAHTP